MVFSSFHFVFGFLPVFLLLYLLSPYKFKNFVALVASLLFYSWSSPKVLVLLIGASLFDYLVSPYLLKKNGKLVLIFSLVVNLLFLFYYKYSNFFIEQLSYLTATQIAWVQVALPAGISFFTFEKISYLVDVYKKKTPPSNSFLNYLLFVSLFPHLIAGPVLKYSDLASQIASRICTKNDVFVGFNRFVLGLAKKLIIADEVAKISNQVFSLDPSELNSTYAWLGLICYAMQIYFDFSGYSDMAIGLARMMGFKFIENFNSPYISVNITDFWKRWHISLTNWIREYIYFPLGGNRVGLIRSYINLVIVFFLSGLWHGASWNFITWGLFHGLFLVMDRAFWGKVSEKLPKFFNIGITFFIVCLGWVLFRSETFIQSAGIYAKLFSMDWGLHLDNYFPAQMYSNRSIFILTVALFFAFIPAFKFSDKIMARFNNLQVDLKDTIQISFSLVLLLISAMIMTEASNSPFLYFQF